MGSLSTLHFMVCALVCCLFAEPHTQDETVKKMHGLLHPEAAECKLEECPVQKQVHVLGACIQHTIAQRHQLRSSLNRILKKELFRLSETALATRLHRAVDAQVHSSMLKDVCGAVEKLKDEKHFVALVQEIVVEPLLQHISEEPESSLLSFEHLFQFLYEVVFGKNVHLFSRFMEQNMYCSTSILSWLDSRIPGTAP